MQIYKSNNIEYKLPDQLTDTQRNMYIHLIDWKWKNVTKKPGVYNHKGIKLVYDSILPDDEEKKYGHIYLPIRKYLKSLRFKRHPHFYHMVSSQAANINLFLPILLNPRVNEVLRLLKSDFNTLAIENLNNGFELEYWGNEFGSSGKGLLNDHNSRSGTDSDIAIAYYNKNNELCLWLIEHKLMEKEFTECGGFKSKGNKTKKNCSSTYSEIIADQNLCYYHKACAYNYWNVTKEYPELFINNNQFSECPFKYGMNQLWRNQLLALSIEKHPLMPYKNVSFSVVAHPANNMLSETIKDYKKLTSEKIKFSTLTSLDVLKSAKQVNDGSINEWIEWYSSLYNIIMS